MEHIGSHLKAVDRNIRLRNADAASTRGFTMVPNFLLDSNSVSPGAKLACNRLRQVFSPMPSPSQIKPKFLR